MNSDCVGIKACGKLRGGKKGEKFNPGNTKVMSFDLEAPYEVMSHAIGGGRKYGTPHVELKENQYEISFGKPISTEMLERFKGEKGVILLKNSEGAKIITEDKKTYNLIMSFIMEGKEFEIEYRNNVVSVARVS